VLLKLFVEKNNMTTITLDVVGFGFLRFLDISSKCRFLDLRIVDYLRFAMSTALKREGFLL